MGNERSVVCLAQENRLRRHGGGNARRFGRNKLEENVGGVRIIRRALEAVPRGELVRVVVVSQYAEIEALAAEYGFLAVHNGDPGAG